MTLMKLRSDFLFTVLCQYFWIYLVVFALSFLFSDMGKEVTWSHLSRKIKLYNLNPNQKSSKFNKEKIAQRNSLKPKAYWNFKVLLGLIINTTTLLISLHVFFPIQQELWHNNMMSDKALNFFAECAAECVHLCPAGIIVYLFFQRIQ